MDFETGVIKVNDVIFVADVSVVVNLTFADYKVPVQKDIPPFRTILLQTPGGPGPFGAKAIGESSSSAIAPAIANAVARACGIRVPHLPITAERILNGLHKK